MVKPFTSLFLTVAYSGAWALAWSVLNWGVERRSSVAIDQPIPIPDRCILSQDFVDRSIEQLRQNAGPQPPQPELLKLFEQPGALPIDTTAPDLIPVDVSYFEAANENQIQRYRLGPGDVVFIDVFVNGQRSAELSVPQAIIGPEGVTFIPLVGTVRLEGLLTSDIEQDIQSRLNQFVRNPEVKVSLLSQRPVQVTVTGSVARPGFYPIASPQLPVALTTAGGTNPDANLRAVQLRRTLSDGRIVSAEIDLLTPLTRGVVPPNIRLEDKDVIFIPTQEIQVYQGPERDIIETYSLAAAPTPVQVTVVGEVIQPGYYTLPAGLGRVSSGILAAGGATLTADLRSVLVCRTTVDGRVIQEEVDLYTPLEEATALPDISLSNGDSIIVPKLPIEDQQDYDQRLIARSTLVSQQITVRILSKPGGTIGALNLPNGSTFVDILGTVPLQTARIDKITLIRFDPQQGKAITRDLNAAEILEGLPEDNILLLNNDVFVIDRNFATNLTFFLNNFTQPFRDILGFLLFIRELGNAAEDLFGPSGNNRNDN
ncbi:MAG: SLBB domain-containing protein, partial [Microcoleaceae cyanobacterium]